MLICSALTSPDSRMRSEEHTSELQSQSNLVCRLLLEKKKKSKKTSSNSSSGCEKSARCSDYPRRHRRQVLRPTSRPCGHGQRHNTKRGSREPPHRLQA